MVYILVLYWNSSEREPQALAYTEDSSVPDMLARVAAHVADYGHYQLYIFDGDALVQQIGSV